MRVMSSRLALTVFAVAGFAPSVAAENSVAVPSFVEETASAGIDSVYTGEWEYMRQSSEAFRLALTVYKDHGAGRMAVITERNLQRAEKQIHSSHEQHISDPVWAQSFNIPENADYDWQSFLDGTGGNAGERVSEVA